MSGRRVLWLVAPLLALALALHARASWGRLEANLRLAAVERMTDRFLAEGARPPAPPALRPYLENHARLLRRAAELDPVEVGIPIARGVQYYLLGRPQAALRAYRQALELEERAEIYANVGRAHLAAGEPEAARAAFRKAIELDYRQRRKLRRELPAGEVELLSAKRLEKKQKAGKRPPRKGARERRPSGGDDG